MNSQPSLQQVAAELKAAVTVMRIIVFALAAGSTMFLFVAITFVDSKELTAIPDGTDPLAWIPVVGLSALALSRIVPAVITRQMRDRLAAGKLEYRSGPQTMPLAELGDAGVLAMIYQTQLIVSCRALLEGAAFLCGIFVMVLHGGLPALAMAIILILAILVKFPSPLGVATWIARQTEQIETDRTLSARNPMAGK